MVLLRIIRKTENQQGFLLHVLERVSISRTSVNRRIKSLYIMKGDTNVVTYEMSDLSYHKVALRGNITLISGYRSVKLIINREEKWKLRKEGNTPIGLGFCDEKHVWIGYRDAGLVIYDLQGKYVRSYLIGESVSRVLNDHEGGIWFSTVSTGVYYFRDIDVKEYLINGSEVANYKLSKHKSGDLIVHVRSGKSYRRTNNVFNLFSSSPSDRPGSYAYYPALTMEVESGIIQFRDVMKFSFDDREIIYKSGYIGRLSDELDKSPLIAGGPFFMRKL